MNTETEQQEHDRLARLWSLGQSSEEQRTRCRALKARLIDLALTTRAYEQRIGQRFTGAAITDFGTFTS